MAPPLGAPPAWDPRRGSLASVLRAGGPAVAQAGVLGGSRVQLENGLARTKAKADRGAGGAAPSYPGFIPGGSDDLRWATRKKTAKLWVWKARDRATGRVVDWECGGRDAATLSRLLERVERWNPRLYRTDDWAAHAELIPQGRLYVGKDQTHGIERDHSRQRHWLARFRRRTGVVSKAERMVDASTALFVRFGDLGGINELLSMLS